METLRSPITGSGGGLPGTGRAPAILPAPAQAPTAEGSEPATAPTFAEVAGEHFAAPAVPEPAAPPNTALEVLEVSDPVPDADPVPAPAPGVPVTDEQVPPAPALPRVLPVVGQPARGNLHAQIQSQAPARDAASGSPPPAESEPSGTAPLPFVPEPPAFPATPVAPLVEDGRPETPLPEAAAPASPEAEPEAFAAPLSAARTPGDATVSPSASSAPLADDAAIEKAAEVLRQIQAELRPGARRIRVDLDPPELGRLVIRAALVEGKVTAVVEAESAATLELLERQAPELLAALREAGVEAKSLSLELSSNHSRGQGSGQDGETKHMPSQPTRDAEQDERANRREYRTRTSNAGDGVDTYA